MKKTLALASLMIMMLFLAFSAYAEEVIVEKQIKVEEKLSTQKMDELQDIKNPNAGFKIELWTDRKDDTYKVGDEVVFYFRTNRDCYLTLLNVTTTGKVHILFPNKYQKDNLVKAGKVYRFPPEDAKYVFRLTGPAGIELVKAIATIDEVTL